jgi:hypothetical protein
MGLREYARTPVLLALLTVMPVYFVGVFTVLLPASDIPVTVPGEGRQVLPVADVYGVLLVPLIAGLIGGIAGLFLMQAAREADARLVLAGYRARQVVLARFGLLAVASALATAVSLGVLAPSFVPERPLAVAAAGVLAGLTYGLVGMLVGLLAGKLAGVYAMLFVPMLDVFFLQNPTASDSAAVASFLPGDAVVELALDAGFSADVALHPLGRGLALLAVVVALAAGAFYRTARVR